MYIHISIFHLSDGDGLDVPGKFSLGDESVLPGQVAHAEGGDVSQEDAVKLKCVRAPPADNQDVISELPRPNEAGKHLGKNLLCSGIAWKERAMQ